jgi:hypothetical protein
MEKTRHGNGTRNKENSRNDWRLATWNIRALSGKENELIEECQKVKVGGAKVLCWNVRGLSKRGEQFLEYVRKFEGWWKHGWRKRTGKKLKKSYPKSTNGKDNGQKEKKKR